MKIKKITIQDYRGCGNFEATLSGQPLVLLGLNGAGKSTVLSAIQVVLCGRTYYEDGTAILFRDLVAERGHARIALDVSDPDGTITATIKQSGMTVTCPGGTGQAALQKWLDGATGAPSDIVGFAVDPRAALMGGSVADVLGQMLCPEIALDRLRDWSGPQWPTVEKLLCGNKKVTPDTLASIGAVAEQNRRELKKQLAVAQQTIDRNKTVQTPLDSKNQPIKTTSIPALADAIKKLQDEEIALHRLHGSALAQETGLPVSGARLKKMREDVAEIEKRMKLYGEQAQEFRRAEADCLARYRLAEQKIRNTQYAAWQLRRELSDLAVQQTSQGNKCPTCQRPYTKEMVGAALKAIQDRVESAKKAIAGHEAEERAAMEEVAKHKHDADQARQSATALDEKAVEQSKKLGAAREGYGAATKRLSVTESPESITEKIRALSERIKIGQEKLSALRLIKECEDAESAKIVFEIEIERQDWAIKAFRDGGFVNEVVGNRLAGFEASCNEWLSKTKNHLRVWFEVNKTKVLTGITLPSGARVPIRQCSKGERKLAEMALVLSTMELHPGIVICIDDADALDVYNKTTLFQSVAAAPSTSIIASCWQNPKLPDLTVISQAMGVQAIWVGGGL